MGKGYEALSAIMPAAPGWSIDWNAVAESPFLEKYVDKMAKTLQDFADHGEGDVWAHTQYVSPTGVLEKFECDPENAYTIRPTPEYRVF